MHEDIIDYVYADDIQLRDCIEQGEVIRVADNPNNPNMVDIYTDADEEPITYHFAHLVPIYGSFSTEV